jgi:hypothetical protein
MMARMFEAVQLLPAERQPDKQATGQVDSEALASDAYPA